MQEQSRGQRGTWEQAKDSRLPSVQKSRRGFKVAIGVQKKTPRRPTRRPWHNGSFTISLESGGQNTKAPKSSRIFLPVLYPCPVYHLLTTLSSIKILAVTWDSHTCHWAITWEMFPA